MMKFLNVKNPVWTNKEKTQVDCEVEFEGLGIVPFTACPNDSTQYGPEIFDRCVAGDFGPVADYVPPPAPVANQTTAQSVTME